MKRVVCTKVYWCCGQFSTGISNCKSRRVKEEMVYDSFINMLYKLKINREQIIEPFIQQIEQSRQRISRNNGTINEIDKKIADLSAKNLVMTRLHANGIINKTEYATQTSEICNKLSELRLERRKQLNEENNYFNIDEIVELDKTLKYYELKNEFDSELFSQIVEKIVVDDSSKLIFYLIGGLKFTEMIRKKGRCKTA